MRTTLWAAVAALAPSLIFLGCDPEDSGTGLGAMIGGASVVALGESVHTTRGYSEVKDRIFRYLVTELGFRVFAFESPRTAARRVGRYVDSCEGDAYSAITQGLFGVWANRSVLELVEWMCAWNRSHPNDSVRFVGFDIQQPWDDASRPSNISRSTMPKA